MKIEFPILTSPESQRFDFLNRFQQIAKSNFKELVVVSPFIDVFIIENVIKRCLFREKKLTIITRYSSNSINDSQRKNIEQALHKVEAYGRSRDRNLIKKVTWYRNERLHAKFIIKDWNLVLFGSQNLTKFGGLTGNYELGCLIEDPKEVEKLRPFVNDLIKSSGGRKLYPKL